MTDGRPKLDLNWYEKGAGGVGTLFLIVATQLFRRAGESDSSIQYLVGILSALIGLALLILAYRRYYSRITAAKAGVIIEEPQLDPRLRRAWHIFSKVFIVIAILIAVLIIAALIYGEWVVRNVP